MTAALSYFDGYTTDRLPANLLQAQRDYFGAHTYERLDAPADSSSIPLDRPRRRYRSQHLQRLIQTVSPEKTGLSGAYHKPGRRFSFSCIYLKLASSPLSRNTWMYFCNCSGCSCGTPLISYSVSSCSYFFSPN